jgi:PAS domain-containing protein
MSSGPSQSSQKQPQRNIFEFTKRRQWADLLVTELSGAINFVLSPHGKVWYCAPAIHELLGWREEELVDKDITDFFNGKVSLLLIPGIWYDPTSKVTTSTI